MSQRGDQHRGAKRDAYCDEIRMFHWISFPGDGCMEWTGRTGCVSVPARRIMTSDKKISVARMPAADYFD
jgi:hypothetical protein